jgi:DNA invertase Pin-like site-specific DNA recombinase
MARAYAAERGLALDDHSYEDLGVSAFRGKNIKTGALGAFLRAAEDGTIPEGSFLLVESLDRLTRADIIPAQLLLMQIVLAGITIVTLTDRRSYSKESITANPTDLIISITIMMRGNEESVTKGNRIAAKNEKKRTDAAAGALTDRPFTRMLPAWLRWDNDEKKHSLIPQRAAVVREIFRKADEGWGQHRIAHWLNAETTETWGAGKRAARYWHTSYVAKILSNSAVVGTFTPHRAQKDQTGKRVRTPLSPIEGYWPPVVDAALFERVAAKRGGTAARGRNADSGKVSSVVAGIAKCARCSGTVTRVTKGEHVYLVCSKANARAKGCEYLAVRYRDVENALTTNAGAIFKAAPRGQDTEELDSEIRETVLRVDELEDTTDNLARELGDNTTPAIRRALEEAERKLQSAIERLRFLRSHRDTLSNATVIKRLRRMRDTLRKKPLDVKEANGALREAVSRIVVDPEAARLTIHWRHSEEPTDDIPFYSRHIRGFQGDIPRAASSDNVLNWKEPLE